MTEPRHLSNDRESEEDRRSQASRQIVTGAIFLGVGLILTVATFGAAASSPSGGTYILAYGPMIYGAITLFRGVAGRNG